jgi:hypothetical protein
MDSFQQCGREHDVYSTPVFYLLDKNKIIKAKRFGVDQLEKLIEVLAKEK